MRPLNVLVRFGKRRKPCTSISVQQMPVGKLTPDICCGNQGVKARKPSRPPFSTSPPGVSKDYEVSRLSPVKAIRAFSKTCREYRSDPKDETHGLHHLLATRDAPFQTIARSRRRSDLELAENSCYNFFLTVPMSVSS